MFLIHVQETLFLAQKARTETVLNAAIEKLRQVEAALSKGRWPEVP